MANYKTAREYLKIYITFVYKMSAINVGALFKNITFYKGTICRAFTVRREVTLPDKESF